ncbi:alpha/beta hydrolase family protein [Marinicella meishanensis]|uniref:alpha/beta hydrolase family protein n=1 Tax=Marinicella meishanensis TaxID=2873263 RepID=UPI001CBFA689|nr:prolyl oligopeptidase family serine peptidase [Marinicella sp. NBU2979]
MKPIVYFLMGLLCCASVAAQEAITYQQPPQAIVDLIDIERAPSVIANDDKSHMLLLYRDQYKSIADLSAKELRLAGLRINPKTNIGSRTTFYNNLRLMEVASRAIHDIQGLPADPRLANFNWSHDQSKVAFTHTSENGVELWYADLTNRQAKQLTPPHLNANMGSVISWFKDDESLLVKKLPADRKALIDGADAIPTGPTVSNSDGSKAQNRTYQDLLKNTNDEFNFEQLAHAELVKVNLKGKSKAWQPSAMYTSVDFSPDGKYVAVTQVQRPFSYLVPYRRFPQLTQIFKANGQLVSNFNTVPLTEEIPKGFMAVREGKRDLQWRADQPATMVWAEALDGGDPEQEVSHRDEVFQVAAPFDGQPESLFKTIDRFYQVIWGDANHALFYDYWWNTRLVRTSMFDPSKLDQSPVELNRRNYQDAYADPGNFVTVPNEWGQDVLLIEDQQAYLIGDGFTADGQFPFIDQYDLQSKTTTRMYQSAYTDKIEDLRDAIDMGAGTVLVRIESPTEFPNYYIRNIKDESLTQITDFANPFASIAGIHKEVITYQRDDGLELSGVLYLPADYDFENKPKLPMVLWAYPTEFKDKNSASQNTNNPNEFTYPYYGSMIYWVTQGYAILDDASFPIVGEGDEEPNDTFVKQLVANGRAAIDAVDQMGYIDRSRVGVAGHSYGAFMTANLLSHSDDFAAGIARSGAYNRTLTPFGFQAEERNYWEAPEIYYNMSPFMHADTMNEPLLLIHGEADNNSGTYPLQTERYFNALKGLGATARMVMLPKESHGYRAKESILHVIWEQHQWLEKYVKNKTD